MYAHVLSSDYIHRVFIITVVQMYLLPQNFNAIKIMLSSYVSLFHFILLLLISGVFFFLLSFKIKSTD